MNRPRVLIEDWLPIPEISVEGRREGSAAIKPPLSRLHVWWARRPLIASRASILGSLLPSWSEDWPDELLERFPTEKDYHEWFVHLLGVRGDPVGARRKLVAAAGHGEWISNPYEGPRAFTLGPDSDDTRLIRTLMEQVWGADSPIVLDPMAGGGSIPFEALRFGFRTRVGELNPVASFVLQGTLVHTAHLGPRFADDIRSYGNAWTGRIRTRLAAYFPSNGPDETALTYIFARTVACPETGKPVPLAPNWWLRKGDQPVAVRIFADPDNEQCHFDLVRGKAIDFDPGTGTVSRGEGRSPWTGATIGGEYIKVEAQAGRMGAQMYAVATKTGRGRDFRLPNGSDLSALAAAEADLSSVIKGWRAADVVPTERYPEVASDMRPHHYGMSEWSKFFSPRQLLVLGTAVEELRSLEDEMRSQRDPDEVAGLVTYMTMALAKMLNYNAIVCAWHPTRNSVANVFDRHDFSFKWSFAEMNVLAPGLGLEWALDQIVDAYRGIADLLEPSRHTLFPARPEATAELVEVRQGDASDLPYQDRSIHAVVVDPPYYDNVQYAELSDFFYVWQKRTVGHLYPEFFGSDLTDKAREAVANPARFEALDKKRARDLARSDYERKMTRVFAEAHRVLRDEGVLTVMFTHKKVEAWDTLGQSLIEAGFEIESSWPVHTEAEHSLHQARKAAASSTILLTCRKRQEGLGATWWDDLQSEVRGMARAKASEFMEAGIEGVDLYIATFGPTLSVISRQWPVYTSAVDPETGEPLPLRPEEALDLAREEVADLRRQGLLLGRDVDFDPVTDWYLLAWDAFGAIEFPYDEARKLALALGLDLEDDLVRTRVVTKKGSTVVIQEPRQRRRPGLADPEETSFARLLDAVHALMVAQWEDGLRGGEGFLKRTRLATDARFQALLQALINAIPRTKEKGRFLRPEAAALHEIAFLFPDLQIPPDPDVVVEPTQATFELEDGGGESSNDEEDEKGEED
jgi:adenine-specific DNA methylase